MSIIININNAMTKVGNGLAEVSQSTAGLVGSDCEVQTSKAEIDMNVQLGNLSIKEMEDRAGVEFAEDLREYMGSRRQHRAENVAKGKWHCFDMPFLLVCGDTETATEIHRHLKDVGHKFKEQLRISVRG